MDTERYFQVPEEKRQPFIERRILSKFSEERRMEVAGIVVRIVENYEGHDINALSVLTYAIGQGRFEEFTSRLEAFYKKDLQFRHPEQRAVIRDFRTEEFFLRCYEDLGIAPSTRLT